MARQRRTVLVPLAALAMTGIQPLIVTAQSNAAAVTSGTNLGGGIQTLTDVEAFAKITLDLAEMTALCQDDQYNDAENIYLAGKNSPKYDRNGDVQPTKRTLAEMSTDAIDGKFDGELPFTFQMYGFAGGSDNYDTWSTYADAFVQDSLKERKGTLGVEGAAALNLWMYAAHVLTIAVEDCSLESSGVNLEIIGRDEDLGGPGSAIDMFIAFWIGFNQVAGSDDGSGLYAMAERAATLFNTIDDNGEANVNKAIKKLYQEAREILSYANACRPNSDSAERLWGVLHRTVSQMQVPLVQLLIDSMAMEDQDRITLYARSVVPQMSQCKASTYRRLKENLLDRSYDPTAFVDILGDLQDVYDCLGFTCGDVGAYRVDKVARCADLPKNYPMAEYSPTSYVHSHSKIDQDVVAIKALLSFDNDKAWASAKDVYMYGKNSEKYRSTDAEPYKTRSLQSLATSAVRKEAPWFAYFEDYHQDPNYADTRIVDTFDGKGKWGKGSREQRAEYIAKTVQYAVLYMYLLSEAADANADCRSGNKNDNEGGAHAWDEVAAYYIGSLEGTLQGGSPDFGDGQLQWNLGNKRSTQFNTQIEETDGAAYAKVNAEIEDDLYAGKGELDAYSCDNLGRTIESIERNSIVPIIQSVIRYAIKNENLSSSSSSKDLAEGEAFTLAALPIVKSVDDAGATVLEKNMIIQDGVEPVADGAQRVADAFYMTMMQFELECELVGESDGVDACEMFRKMGTMRGWTRSPAARAPGRGGPSASLLGSVILSTVAALGSTFVLLPAIV